MARIEMERGLSEVWRHVGFVVWRQMCLARPNVYDDPSLRAFFLVVVRNLCCDIVTGRHVVRVVAFNKRSP
jgi:hypothetical protein